jgi:hypothetical protein
MTPLVQVPLVLSAVDGTLLIVLGIRSVQLTVTRIIYSYVSSYLACSELRYTKKTPDFILKITFFWVVPPWSLVERSWNVVTVFFPEDGGSSSHQDLRGNMCCAIQYHVKNFHNRRTSNHTHSSFCEPSEALCSHWGRIVRMSTFKPCTAQTVVIH